MLPLRELRTLHVGTRAFGPQLGNFTPDFRYLLNYLFYNTYVYIHSVENIIFGISVPDYLCIETTFLGQFQLTFQMSVP